MKLKWYLSTLILAFTIIGICHNKLSSPNQEILVQFNSDEVTVEQSQNAIASIKQQLLTFGIEDIQVREDENGKLKISYYSSVDVESIKEILALGESSLHPYTSLAKHKRSKQLPSDQKSKSYNLDIYELQQSTDSNNGSAGKSVMIVKQDFDRYLNPNVSLPFKDLDFSDIELSLKQAYKINRTIAIAIKNTSHTIPEVRAGPFKIGNS